MNSKRTYLSIVSVSIFAVAAMLIAFINRKSPTVADIPKTTNTSAYKNGTYTATGAYESPAGYESITVTLTLDNNVVTKSSVIPNPNDRTSSRYMQKFIGGYSVYVVGQNINNINLGAVSGSSLTPIGFNNALAAIKAQAKS